MDINAFHITEDIEGYKCIPHNGRLRYVRAKVTYGGLCVLIKHSFLVDYKYDTIVKTYERIMVINFMHKHSEYSYLLIARYLPPGGSACGRDSGNVFHLSPIQYKTNT